MVWRCPDPRVIQAAAPRVVWLIVCTDPRLHAISPLHDFFSKFVHGLAFDHQVL